MRAINGNVFIIRDEKEADVDGISISEGAQVGSSYGTIAFIDGGCEWASIGDRVHIPHYGVIDMEIDGREYAVCKADRLFYVNGEPVNGYVLVRKCENDHIRDEDGSIALYMTDKHIEWTNWVEVLEVAPSCRNIRPEWTGLFCPAPESDERLARIGTSKDFCLHEELIEFLTEG
jgi:hypothetical protein